MKKDYETFEPEEDFQYLETAGEEMASYQINRELNMARRLVNETGVNLFLTGKAGTGKTTFLSHLRTYSPKRMVVLAPTGVAAINAEGSTIHSFFQLPFSPYIPGKGFIDNDRRHYNFSREKRRIIASLDLLVIDEISMVRPDTLDAIDAVLRRLRHNDKPFGGVQLLLIGDLRQLAPVMRPEEWNLLNEHYRSEYFFESQALSKSGLVTIELTNVYRQNDPEFVRILNAVRDGAVTPDLMAMVNQRYIPDFNPREKDGYIRLTTHNRMADEINTRRLHALNTTSATYQAQITGSFPDSSFPTESSLMLKIGAQVMFIKNDTGYDRKYYNGMLGHVTELTPDSVTVLPSEGNEPLKVTRVEWENSKYVIDEDTKAIHQVVEGTFTQFPLRLAWAITIHKSQGLTFDRAIIDAGASFAPGQTYVALSRCRTLEGLVLGQKIPVSSIKVDSKVNTFIADCASNSPDSAALDSFRQEYTRHLLAELFDFRAIKVAFDDFYRAVNEYVIPLYPEYYEVFKDGEERITSKIDAVGNKFIQLYASAPVDPDNLDSHVLFLEKIKGGCRYFVSELKRIADIWSDMQISLGNADYVKRLENSCDNLKFQVETKIGTLHRLTTLDFSPANYISAKAEAVLDTVGGEKRPSLRKEKIKKVPKVKTPKESKRKPVGYSKRLSLEMFHQGMGVAEIATERDLSPNTIASHLAEFIAAGELDIKQVIPEIFLDEIQVAFAEADGNFAVVREKLGSAVPAHFISLYYRSVIASDNPKTI